MRSELPEVEFSSTLLHYSYEIIEQILSKPKYFILFYIMQFDSVALVSALCARFHVYESDLILNAGSVKLRNSHCPQKLELAIPPDD